MISHLMPSKKVNFLNPAIQDRPNDKKKKEEKNKTPHKLNLGTKFNAQCWFLRVHQGTQAPMYYGLIFAVNYFQGMKREEG